MAERDQVNPRPASEDPQALRREIEDARSNMGRTADQIEYRVNPRHIKDRQVGRARGRVRRIRVAVMGTAENATTRSRDAVGQRADSMGERAGDMRESAAERASDMTHAVQEAPDRVMESTRGNPLAAGLIAFGVGALAGTLLPSTDPERRTGQMMRDRMEGPAREQARQVGEQFKGRLQGEAQEGMERVKQTAKEGIEETKEQASASSQDVKEHASSASRDVREH